MLDLVVVLRESPLHQYQVACVTEDQRWRSAVAGAERESCSIELRMWALRCRCRRFWKLCVAVPSSNLRMRGGGRFRRSRIELLGLAVWRYCGRLG